MKGWRATEKQSVQSQKIRVLPGTDGGDIAWPGTQLYEDSRTLKDKDTQLIS